jgi:hypothetical protein
MVYIFKPSGMNGGGYRFGDFSMSRGFTAYRGQNKPIPASYFPRTLTMEDAIEELPDIFNINSGFPMFSERARVFVEDRAPGQIEFIPVTVTADPDIARQLRLPGTYHFINVLGRAQRFQWLEMPVDKLGVNEDGIEIFWKKYEYKNWKIRTILPGEPLIWREIVWRFENQEYFGYTDVLIEDILWRALDAIFPGQLEPSQVGISVK